jgi:hypothetical protein
MGANRPNAFLFSLCFTAFAAAGCGGGGGSTSATPPVTPPTSNGSSSTASLLFTIAIPGAVGGSSAQRRPRYISAATKSAAIAFGASRQTVNCAATCSATLVANPGTQTFTISLYDQPNAAGNLLSTGTTTTTIVAGAQNSISVAFGGVPATLAISLGSASTSAGSAAQIPVVVQALDAAGYTIVGPEPYANPIAVSSDDRSGATALSRATLMAPGDAMTLAYNGAATLSAVHLSASVPGTGVPAQSATLTIAAAPPPPSGTFPDHVRTHAYYGLNDINSAVPAVYMAAHVDTVEDDGYAAQHADAFKRAGGKMAIAYTDPTYAAHCPPPFTAPAGKCGGQIANLIPSDESAYVHDATGARIHRYNDPYFQYQEVFNVNAPSMRAAYTQMVASILAHSPLLDGFEADDSGSPLTGPDGVLGSNLYGGFNAAGVEITSDEQYITGASAVLAAAGKPLMINGGDPRGTGPAYGGRFLDLPFVYAQQLEGSFNNSGGYLYSDVDNKFAREENALLAVTARHKQAVAFPTGDNSPAHRLYAYAAWLLSYDATYSAYETNVPLSDGIALWPETQLVPTLPAFTPTDIAQLKRGGVYVREYAACAVATKPIGPCAALVNSSPSATVAVPALSLAYGQHIVLDPQSHYHGGKANVVAGAVTSLAPVTAAILVR